MEAHLGAYRRNKIISLGWILPVIGVSYWLLGFQSTQWQFILLVIIIFGYTHFLIGWYYQLKSYVKRFDTKQQILTFAGLMLVTLGVAEIIYAYLGFVFALLIGFAYFLLHGLFNEQTLIKREAGIHVPLIYVWSLAIFIMTSLTHTIPDPTFLFDRSLEFMASNSFTLNLTFLGAGMPLNVFPYVFWVGIVLSFGVLALAWWQTRNNALTLFLGSSYVLIALLTIFFGAIPYVYMYFLVVGYHFMTWFLFFLRQMSGRSHNALAEYLGIHVVTLIPFLIAGWLFFQPATPAWVYVVFDYKYFVVATYLHISTSFMNDGWFQRLQEKCFARFS